jgi:hypothetical protein
MSTFTLSPIFSCDSYSNLSLSAIMVSYYFILSVSLHVYCFILSISALFLSFSSSVINDHVCSARDWDRIRITWGNPQSGCTDICSYSKRATVGVPGTRTLCYQAKLRYEANQVWMNTTFISQGPQSSGI